MHGQPNVKIFVIIIIIIYSVCFIYILYSVYEQTGTAVTGRCARNRKVAGSIPAGVSGFFTDIKSFRSHYGPGVDSASNRNEYQGYFLGIKSAGA